MMFEEQQLTVSISSFCGNLGNLVLYYLQEGPDRAFVEKGLMYIPLDIEVLPEWVSNLK